MKKYFEIYFCSKKFMVFLICKSPAGAGVYTFFKAKGEQRNSAQADIKKLCLQKKLFQKSLKWMILKEKKTLVLKEIL